MYDVCVLGLGYIGLPTAAVMAESGLSVLGVDIKRDVIDTINKGSIHIVEPGLEELVKQNVMSGNLSVSLEIAASKTFLIAVPTPTNNVDKSPDLSYIESAAKSIAKYLTPGCLVLLESTSPPGTTEKLAKLFTTLRPDMILRDAEELKPNFHIAYCPERVLPGQVIEELRSNFRVIGGITNKCTELAVKFYQQFVDGTCISVSSPRVAEMCKLVENSYRDVNIAFANELSILCHEQGISVSELIATANHHPRVNILQPGPGVGGHCIAVDPWFLVHSNPNSSKLIKKSREINDIKPLWTIERITELISSYVKNKGENKLPKLAMYGLSFKPNIDDLRESPALQIAIHFAKTYSGEILFVEPNIHNLPQELISCELVSIEQALTEAELHIVLVGHEQFKSLSFNPDKTYFAVNL